MIARRIGESVEKRAASVPAIASSQTLKKKRVGIRDVSIDQNIYAGDTRRKFQPARLRYNVHRYTSAQKLIAGLNSASMLEINMGLILMGCVGKPSAFKVKSWPAGALIEVGSSWLLFDSQFEVGVDSKERTNAEIEGSMPNDPSEIYNGIHISLYPQQ